MMKKEEAQPFLSTFGRVLYYPHFYVHNVNWLKAALLYWDEISRIVPERYRITDPEELKPASEFMITMSPEPYIDRAEATFRQHVLPLADHPDTSIQMMLESVANASRRSGAWVHAGKMTYRLQQDLHRRGILRHGCGERLFLSEGFDALYMTCLAKEIGLATGRPPVTDAKGYADCQSLLLFEGKPPPRPSVSKGHARVSMLVELGIAMPSASQLSRVSLKSIVKHHQKRGDERRAFRLAVEKIVAAASGIKDPVALSDYLSQRRREIAREITDYRKTLHEVNVTAVESALKVSCPAWLLSAGALAKGLDPGITTAMASLGLGLGFVAWWAKVRKERRQVVALCPWHYWIETHRRFGRQ